MASKIIFGVLGALAIYLLLMSWHEKDKEVNALTAELNVIHEVLNEKEKDRLADEAAIKRRDEEFEAQNKKLDSINSNLRRLAASNKELSDMLKLRIRPELLRGLKTYSTESQAPSPNAAPARATDKK